MNSVWAKNYLSEPFVFASTMGRPFMFVFSAFWKLIISMRDRVVALLLTCMWIRCDPKREVDMISVCTDDCAGTKNV